MPYLPALVGSVQARATYSFAISSIIFADASLRYATMSELPKVSIITVTYNASTVLEPTLRSIAAQTYPNIELLIIDGKSKDETLAIAEQYRAHITQIVSEPDRGIFDAMNKGIALATGEYVWFMNAGDEIFAPDTLSRVMHTAPDADVYYGEAEFWDITRTTRLGLRSEVMPLRLPVQLTWRSLAMGFLVCHQSMIVRRRLAVPYDLRYRLSNDYDWAIRVLKSAKRIVHTHAILSVYRQGGKSRQYLWATLSARFAIMQAHFGLLPTLWNHVRITLRGVWFVLRHRKGY